MTLIWRGRARLKKEEQVANACDSFVDLTPASDAPAVQTRTNWSALLPGQAVPLIGEDRRYGYREEVDDC